MKPFDLNNTKLNSGFNTPSEYFNNLEDSILAKINSTEQKPIKKLWVKELWFFNSVAASLLLMLGIVFYNYTKTPQLDKKYLESYLISNTTSDEIYNNFTEKDFQELTETILNKQDIHEYVSVDFEYYSNLENE